MSKIALQLIEEKRIMMIRFLQVIFLLLFSSSLLAQNSTRFASVDLNLRVSPNTNSQVLTTIRRAEKVKVIEDCVCKWIPVSYQGTSGYVSKKYLSVSKPSKIKHYTNSKGRRVQSPTHYESAPSGATARCQDGTYSFSQSRRGTCSHHGGVAKWL